MAFGGTIKLKGEDEYRKALSSINSNLKAVSSELKLVSTEFENNGYKVGDLRTKNEALNKKLQEEQNIVKLCAKAIEDFTEQQVKNKNEIDKLQTSLEQEKNKLDKMKDSFSSTSKEIEEQEKLVAKLQQELSKSQSAYESNNKTINDYKTKLNDAKTECSVLSKEIEDNDKILSKTKDNFKDNAKSIKEFADEEENASNKTLTLGDLIKGNLISEGIIAGIKGLAGAMKTVGSAIIDVTKEAIQSYAEYEQLVGGVETLFKDSASIVEGYANNAYKTAGLSANEYMSTVTSFSASLLQSLNGDTEKSAKIADMAITDMADNANKMGTSMEMIQSAYQGFAKQNYTMLDNLKLGYGGTKTEMERLLKDATAISGVKYDISNLNDVYEAIHVIQTELGITGTTAKEASSTISGSLSSVKSAWQNLLVGVADSNADWGTLVSNFIDSIVIAAENLLPRIQETLEGVGYLVTDVLGMLLDKILPMGMDLIQNLITGMQSMMPDILVSINNAIGVIINGIITMLPQIIQMGVQLLVSLVQGIAQSLPTLIPTIIDAVVLIVETLLDNIDLIIDAGIAILLGLVDGIINALPKLIDKIPEIIEKLVTAISNNLPKIIEAGIQITISVAGGLIKAIPQLISKVPEIISAIVKGLLNGLGSITEVGKNLVQGLWNGINNAKDWVLDKIKGFGKSILNGIKSFFGINSPSKVFEDEIGKNLAFGVGEGFETGMSKVVADMKDAMPSSSDLMISPTINQEASNISSISNLNDANLVLSLQEALKGMTIQLDGEKVGKFVVGEVEKVVFS